MNSRSFDFDPHAEWPGCFTDRARMQQLLCGVEQEAIGLPPPDCEEEDPRQVVAETIHYFEANASRMRYPQYRLEGLPVTSAHMESYVKEMKRDVEVFRRRRERRGHPGSPFAGTLRRRPSGTTLSRPPRLLI